MLHSVSFLFILTALSSKMIHSFNSTTNTTADPSKHNKKPTNKPVYRYPTTKPILPINKTPTKKPLYRYPTTKPIIKPVNKIVPTKKPIYKYPSKSPFNPSHLSTIVPSSPPTFGPSAVPALSCLLPCLTAATCFCNIFTHSNQVNYGPNVILCYNTTKPNMYFGVYNAAEVPIFKTNLIVPNPTFPTSSKLNVSCGSAGMHDNIAPLDSLGTAYQIGTEYYVIFNEIGDSGLNVYGCNATASSYEVTVDVGAVDCLGNHPNENATIGFLQGNEELTHDSISVTVVAVVVSIILTVFVCVVMFILYRKYKNNNLKQYKDINYDMEIFYITNGDNNYSHNPMETSRSSEHGSRISDTTSTP